MKRKIHHKTLLKEEESNFVPLRDLIRVDIKLALKKQPPRNWSGLVIDPSSLKKNKSS
jgi:hypothetical protein